MVKEAITSLYEEFVAEEAEKGISHSSHSKSFGSSFNTIESQQSSAYNWDDFDAYCAEVETSEPKKSELEDYLEKGRLKKMASEATFSAGTRVIDAYCSSLSRIPLKPYFVKEIGFGISME
ncbi:hypothetical protein M9H77_35495 [Catharanthus roseus]|uniref:Uncharacterized protein n=1 Tax=Catharanthus roseus TaxID=4058 RepID=A0ACB9ZPF9_CATRO|nr:hypothetical protein M9H77_35495 [Catharanthus roseus]